MTKYEIPIKSKKKKSARIPIGKLHDFMQLSHKYEVERMERNRERRQKSQSANYDSLQVYRVLKYPNAETTIGLTAERALQSNM